MTYLLQKIVNDEANRNYGEVWNQLVVLEVNCAPEDLLEAAANKKTVTLSYFMSICKIERVCWQHSGESESEFIARAEKQIGTNIDYVVHMSRSLDWKLSAIKLLKLDKGNNLSVVYANDVSPFIVLDEIQKFEDVQLHSDT